MKPDHSVAYELALAMLKAVNFGMAIVIVAALCALSITT